MKLAIYGPMCSGKTTVAEIIKEIDPRYEIFSFGKKIKRQKENHHKIPCGNIFLLPLYFTRILLTSLNIF